MASLWLKYRALPGWILPLIIGIVILLLPQFGVGYAVTRQVELTLLLALIVSGLNLSLGYAGELAMGQVAMYAAGAYTAGLVSKAGYNDIFLQLLVGALAALLVGFISGIPGLRLGGWSLAMTSFFLILLIPDVLSIFKDVTGGRNGLTGIRAATLFGTPITQSMFYILLVVIAILWFAALRNIIVSQHGTALRVLKQSPVLARSVGISVFRTKLMAYTVGAIPAGVAGVLFANLDLFISPEAFGFAFAMTALAASIFGGSASVYGALVGAMILQFGLNQATNFAEYGIIIVGAFLVVGGVVFSGGVAGVGIWLVRRFDNAARAKVGTPAVEAEAVVDPLDGERLVVTGMSKAFGGNQALKDVSIVAEPGQVTALIGPNGSGKTTLLNMISGFYKADSGTVELAGEHIQGKNPADVTRAGVSRTFQTPNVPEKLTVMEVVESGYYAAEHASVPAAMLRLPKYWRIKRKATAEAERVLRLVGLEAQRYELADALPLGNRRLLEVARCLVSSPRVLLLDETASGLDEDELEVLESLIRRLRDAGQTVVLVEHNFQLVLRLADDIYVLAQGQVMAHGDSAEIEHNPRVRAEYLGIHHDEAAEEVRDV